eukprot:Gb_05905 [translate_table: standard]
MEPKNTEGSSVAFNEIEYNSFAMDKSSEADSEEKWKAVGMYGVNADGVFDEGMPRSVQDDSAYVENILLPFEETQEFFEDLECRFTVSAMVADAVTIGMVNAVLEESSEALAAKDAEIIALNNKLEDKDVKLWKLEETLHFKQEELAIQIAERKSDIDRLVLDFMHEKERLQRELRETEVGLKEKEKQLAEKTESMLEMARKSEADGNRIMVMEEQMRNSQEVEALNGRKGSALVEELERAKAEKELVCSSIREEFPQNGQVENLERCVSRSIYEGHVPDLALSRGTLETERHKSGIFISSLQWNIENLKEDYEAQLLKKKSEVSDLSEELEESKVCNELQTSVIVGILETFIQESEHQSLLFRQYLDSKDKQISSLACMVDCKRLECERLQSQISSNHVIDAEIENNLSTLKAAMEMQCSKLKEDLEEERKRIRDDLSRITKLQYVNNGLAERMREQKRSLEQVEEKLAEQQWQQEIEIQFINQVFGSKLGDAMQLITVLNSNIEEKETEVGSYLKTTLALEAALNAENLKVSRLQERLKGFESQFNNMSSIDLQEMDSTFNNINAKFLQMALKLESLEEISKMCFQQIQHRVVSFQEEHLEQQWKQDFAEDINALVITQFFKELEDQFKTKEQNESKPSELQVRWDEGRLALMNEISSLRQELEQLKIEEPVKSTFSSDGGSSNGFQFLSRLTQEVKNGDSTDLKRKDRRASRFVASQLSTDTVRLEENHATIATGKVAEGHSTRELDSSEHIPTDSTDVLESPLKSMSKEQLMAHFKRVVAELKRQRECIVEEKTEEIYRLKRDFLRERDSCNSRDKEFEALKKRFSEVTRKLDKVVEENDKLSVSRMVEDKNYEIVCKLKDELQEEKKSLLEMVTKKEKELKVLSDKFSDALRENTEHLSTEMRLLKQIAELETKREEMDIQNRNTIDILRTLFEETVEEKCTTLNLLLKEREEIMKQKILFEDMMHAKDRAFNLAFSEKEDHKQRIALLEKLIEEKEIASGLASGHLEEFGHMEKQKASLDFALKECEELKKQKVWLESVIVNKDSAIDLVTKEQEELKKQVISMKEAMEVKENALQILLSNFEEAKKEKISLEGIIQEKENTLCLFAKKEEDQRKQFDVVIAEKENARTLVARNVQEQEKTINSLKETLEQKELSLKSAIRGKEEAEQWKSLLEADVEKLWDVIKNMEGDLETVQNQNKIEAAQCIHDNMDASLEFECRVIEKIQDNVLRLEGVKQQLMKLGRQANAIALRESHYREKLERKCRNLQKAEEEVDLLGDEVDTLISLLEKVYAALDHYLPILQHYPGILDLVKLIKRELTNHVDSGLQL